MDAVVVALIGAIVSLGLAAFAVWRIQVEGRIRRGDIAAEAQARSEEKERDWARQDLVALRATQQLAAIATRQDKKLDDLHTLGNSQLDRALRAELASAEAYLAVLLELIAIKNGNTASAETLAVVKTTQTKIAELKVTLAERVEEAKKITPVA